MRGSFGLALLVSLLVCLAVAPSALAQAAMAPVYQVKATSPPAAPADQRFTVTITRSCPTALPVYAASTADLQVTLSEPQFEAMAPATVSFAQQVCATSQAVTQTVEVHIMARGNLTTTSTGNATVTLVPHDSGPFGTATGASAQVPFAFAAPAAAPTPSPTHLEAPMPPLAYVAVAVVGLAFAVRSRRA